MPIVYRCSRCGFPLHVFIRVGQSTSGVRTPSQVIYVYGGYCPRCGKPLRPPTLRDIEIDTRVAIRLKRLIEDAERMHVPMTSIEQQLASLGLSLSRRSEAEEAGIV